MFDTSNEELARHIQNGEAEYLPQLWEQCRRLIFKLAYGFYTVCREICDSAGIEVKDLHNAGYFALCDAVQAYSPPFKFTSFLRYPLLKQWNTMIGKRHQPVNILDRCSSLDEPVKLEEGGATLWDITPDPYGEDAIKAVDKSDYIQRLHCTLERCFDMCLSDTERAFVTLYYYDGHTYEQISKQYKITAERVRQVIYDAFRKLRRGKTYSMLRSFTEHDIIDSYAYRGSLSAWKRTGESSTEYAVRMLEKYSERIGNNGF